MSLERLQDQFTTVKDQFTKIKFISMCWHLTGRNSDLKITIYNSIKYLVTTH